ncbi:unnamed protein product, partial [Oppiella nova]
EWILNEEQLGVIKAKILNNRIKRSHQKQCKRLLVSKPRKESESESTDTDISPKSSDSSTNSPQNTTNTEPIDTIVAKPTPPDTNTIYETYISNQTEIISVYNSYSGEKLHEFQSYVVSIAKHISDYTSSLNDVECNKLIELFNAINFIREPSLPTQPVISDILNLKVAMVQKLDNEIRRFINVAQNVSEFGYLCENDRIALIKYGAIEIICLRLIQFYNFDARHWTLFMERNKWILSKLDQLRSESLKRGFRTGFAKIGDEWDSDPIILDLLTVILLFDSNRPNLTHRHVIKLQQNIYMYLLQRYLLLKYKSEFASKTKFLNLMNALIDINAVGKVFTRRCYLTDPKCLGPFLREILDVRIDS